MNDTLLAAGFALGTASMSSAFSLIARRGQRHGTAEAQRPAGLERVGVYGAARPAALDGPALPAPARRGVDPAAALLLAALLPCPAPCRLLGAPLGVGGAAAAGGGS